MTPKVLSLPNLDYSLGRSPQLVLSRRLNYHFDILVGVLLPFTDVLELAPDMVLKSNWQTAVNQGRRDVLGDSGMYVLSAERYKASAWG